MRSKGMGTIYRRGTGWAAAISHEGKRRSFYGATKKEAQDKLLDALAARTAGHSIAPRERKIKPFLEAWLTEVSGTVRAATLDHYTWAVGHIIPELGALTLKALSPAHVSKFLADKSTSLSPQSVRHLKSALRAALSSAEIAGAVNRNVARLARAPKMIARELQIMTPEQKQIFKRAIAGHRLESLFIVAMATGCRQSELLGLRWSDVDLVKNEISFRGQLEFRKKQFSLVELKTSKSARTLETRETTHEQLARRHQAQLLERMAAGQRWSGNQLNLVFTSSNGSPLFARNLRSTLQSLLTAAGLPELTFHSLRHTAASELLSEGVSPIEVASILGHSSPAMIFSRYGHVIPADRGKAADVMERSLAAAAGL